MEPSAIHYEALPEATANPEAFINQLADNLEFGTVYSLAHQNIDGLDIGWWGGRWSGFAVAEGTATLTNAADNYLVVLRSTGALSISTSATNWNNTAAYARDYKITTAGGVITAIEDHRAGVGGVHGSTGSAGGATAGRHLVYVSAAAMRPSATGGCAALATIASGANLPDIVTLDFDATTQEFAQFSISMPKSWNEGTITFKPIWSHAAAASFTVVWSLQAVAVSNDDTIAAAFGTAQLSIDTGGTTNDLYVGPESSAITVGGSPQAEDVVFFRIARETDDSSQSLDVDARLHGIQLFITTDADNDA